MFIGREQELADLDEIYRSNGFQMTILYGRRRIGKTTLLNEFAADKNPVFYTATENSAEENLRSFSREVFRSFHGTAASPVFASYEEMFFYIAEQVRGSVQEQKKVVIIDEYPYLVQAVAGISSVLQKVIDTSWKDLNIYFILCGSSISLMEDEVLSSKSPLYGRRTSQMDLKSFDYLTSAEFVPNYTPEDKALVYGVTGGIPKYLSLFDPDRTFDKNMVSLFFRDSGYFYEEPKNLLLQEFRNMSLYNSVIEAIASGAGQLSEIAAKAHLDSPAAAQAVRKLIRVRLVRKDTPILNKKNRRLIQYNLTDGMFRFWYRFVSGGAGAIERGFGEMYYQQNVKPNLHDFMGLQFEEMCREYTFRHGVAGEYGCLITNVGKWRGHDNLKREPADIDVVGVDAGRNAVIGECKFKNEKFGKKEFETLADRARLILPYIVRQYLCFSLSGFTDAIDEAAADKPVRMISLDSMYQDAQGRTGDGSLC